MVRKIKKNTIIWGLSILLLLGGLYILNANYGWLGGAPIADTGTDITINVYGEYTQTVVDDDDHQIYPYYLDGTSLTEADILIAPFADYTLATSFNGGEDFTTKANYVYKFKINGSDYVDSWLADIDDVFFGKTISVYIMNTTGDVGLGLLSTDELDANFDNTILDKWTVYTQTLTAAEGTGVSTAKEGYKAFFDESTELWNSVVLRVGFNTTAVEGYATLTDDLEYDTVVSGNYIYFQMHTTIIDDDTFHFTLSAAALNATVAGEDVAIGYNSAASFTQWDIVSL